MPCATAVATVRTEHGDEVVVRRAVVADVSAPALCRGLVDWADLPARLRSRMSRFEWDPGTVKVDWALDGPVPWTSAPEQAPGTVHVAETVEEVVLAGAQVGAGAVPAEPFLLMGQMAAADPSRAAIRVGVGLHARAAAHVHGRRRRVRPPATCELWDHDDCERFADRMQARFGTHPASPTGWSPGRCSGRASSRRGTRTSSAGPSTVAPPRCTSWCSGRSRGRPRGDAVRGLYLGSASAHPGGGVHGACGANAARAPRTRPGSVV